MRDSGIVPSQHRRKSSERALRPATVLQAPRTDLSDFGSALSGARDALVIGGRLRTRQPYAALYRLHADRAVRVATTHGVSEHDGPCLATDGRRIVMTQPHASHGFANVYRCAQDAVALETTLRRPDDLPTPSAFAQSAAVAGELLVLGHSASVAIYRHSAVSWLSTGTLRPQLPYGWNPRFGRALAVLDEQVFVGNPVEVEGHRAGPGRVLVYRQRGERSELTCELRGDGIESGRREPYPLGFGAAIHAAGELVAITAPSERSRDGHLRARVYLYRRERDTLSRYAQLTVPNCQHGVCIVGDRLFVLGDRLYVYARAGRSLQEVASYDRAGAEAIVSCGEFIALAHPRVQRVSLHVAAQL